MQENQSEGKQLFLAIRPYLRLPEVAWGTLILLMSSFVLWILSIALALQGKISFISLFCLTSIAFYSAYTPFHEAVHGAVGKSFSLNLWVGRLAGIVFISPFRGFQYVHLQHHAHTNHPTLDPDYWSARSFLLVRWMTQDIYYYYYYLREVIGQKLARHAVIEVLAQLFTLFLVFVIGWRLGYGKILIWGWLVPGRAVITFLSFIFDFLPHYPHGTSSENQRYTDTLVRSSPLLDFPFFLQNYHNIHHLYPKVPFYRYKKIWQIGRNYYLKMGTHEEMKLFKLYSGPKLIQPKNNLSSQSTSKGKFNVSQTPSN